MNIREDATIQSPIEKEEECAKFVIDNIDSPFVLNKVMKKGNEYILGFYVKSEADGILKIADRTIETNENWTRHEIKINSDEENLSIWFKEIGTYYFYHTQLELGNKATDFVESPDDTDEKISKTWTLAEQTSDRFRWLVGGIESETEFTLTDRMATLIAETISLNGDVKVNGDMILDGSVTADKIDVKDLFAQDISATGTINGLSLTGTKGQFDSIDIRNNINITFKDKELNDKTIELINVYARYEMDDPDTEIDESNDVIPYIWFGADEARIGIKGVRVDMHEAALIANRVYSTYPIMEEGLFLQDKYVQPYRPGDSFSTLYNGAGYVTNSSTSVWFTIPIAKPCSAVSNVKITNDNGLIIRQGGKYLYGSSSTEWVKPSSYYASVLENAIRIDATFDNTTNVVTNNDACGVEASIRITFS